MTVLYARSDVVSINVGEGHGGCGQPHVRGIGTDGMPDPVFFVDCPECEGFLRSNPLWASSMDDVPEAPDELKARLAMETRGTKALTSLRVLALARMAGVTPGEISGDLSKMLTAGTRVRVPGLTVCSEGHDNAPGSRFCSTCGEKMTRAVPAAAVTAGGAE